MEYMAAHLSKIHGLDWHPDNEFVLATSSQDNSVRVSFTSRKGLTFPLGHMLWFCKQQRQEEPEEPWTGTLILRTCLLTHSPLCLVLGLPPAQEVPEHPVLPGSCVEGQVHGKFQRLSRSTRNHPAGPSVQPQVW